MAASKKARIHVKSLADAMKQLREALIRVTDAEANAQSYRERNAQVERELRSAKHDVEVTRANFGDLKKKLYDAEIENARLRGFMERVREDDAVRDPLVEVEDQMGKRQVTKRFPSNTPINYTMQHNDYSPSGLSGCMEQREKPKHWTSY